LYLAADMVAAQKKGQYIKRHINAPPAKIC